jgi:hypothetical protein
MLEQLTYKKKNKLLILVAVLLFFIVYGFGIKKTIVAYRNYTDAEKQIQLGANAPVMAAELENQLMQMDAKIGTQNKTGQNTEQELLEVLTNYCQTNHAVLREFPESTTAAEDKLLVETNLFVVAGNFSTLINLVYLLEQKAKLGKVGSVHYQLKKDIKSKEMVLTATIYLQNIKKKENEN